MNGSNFTSGLYQTLSELDDRRRSYDITLIFQDGAHSVAHQILTKYLNSQLKYYNFRFLKTNGSPIEILHPVSILTSTWSSICDRASAGEILSELDYG